MKLFLAGYKRNKLPKIPHEIQEENKIEKKEILEKEENEIPERKQPVLRSHNKEKGSSFLRSAMKKRLQEKVLEEANEPQELIEEDTIDSLLSSLGPNGVSSLFTNYADDLPKDVYICLKINCSEEFHDKYKDITNPLVTEGKDFRTKTNENVIQINQVLGEEMKEENTKLINREKEKIPLEEEERKEYFKKIYKQSKNNLNLLKKSLENVVFVKGYTSNKLIEDYKQSKSKRIKTKDPKRYELGLQYYNKNEIQDKFYWELDFEDVLILFCSVIVQAIGIKIRLELGRANTCLFMILFDTEENYLNLAEFLRYECQLKPYAYVYEYYNNEKIKLKIEKLKNSEKNQIDEEIETINECDLNVKNAVENGTEIQYEDCNDRDPTYWPPYCSFIKYRRDRFRKYTRNDLYHACPEEMMYPEKKKDEEYMYEEDKYIPEREQCKHLKNTFVEDPDAGILDNNVECTCNYECSYFRNIDKIRLLYDVFDKLIQINELKNKKFIDTIIIKRHNEAYAEALSFSSLIGNCVNIFSKRNFKYLINLIRNYYGEIISFYFAWLEHYIQWLFFPAIIGTIVGVCSFFVPNTLVDINETNENSPDFTISDVFLLSYSTFIIAWAAFFLNLWKQKEKFYSYIWGTENFKQKEPDNELFESSMNKKFVFGNTLKYYENWKRRLKQIFSYIVLLIMVAATVCITFFLMKYKLKFMKVPAEKYFWYNSGVTAVFATINSLQVKIFNISYTYLADFLNRWENHKKTLEKDNSLAIKLLIFDFFNCYTVLFYIGIYKPAVHEACAGTCLQELGTQLYTTFAINLGMDFVEMGLPFVWYFYNLFFYKREIEKSGRDIEGLKIAPYSFTHQLLCEEYSNLIYEYNEMIILFGYMCLFSVTAPFTPVIVLILAWIEKIGDILKIFFMERVQIIHQATGIDIYNQLLVVLMFLGMLSNTAIVLFSKETHLGYPMMYKLFVFIGVENFVLIMIYVLQWNSLPFWFNDLTELKSLYTNKYLYNETWPHKTIIDDIIKLKEEVEDNKKNENEI